MCLDDRNLTNSNFYYHPALHQMCQDVVIFYGYIWYKSPSCQCQQNPLWRLYWGCHRFIPSDQTWLDGVSQSQFKELQSLAATLQRPPLDNNRNFTPGIIREQIWIFYFWFIEVIIYFFIVPLLTGVGKCFVFYMSLPHKCIKCKEIKCIRDTVCEMSGL